MKESFEYEIREIDAWAEDEDDNGNPIWSWNTSYHMDDIKTTAEDHKTAFLRWIHQRYSINLRKARMYIACDDGAIYELRTRKDDEPILAMIPKF